MKKQQNQAKEYAPHSYTSFHSLAKMHPVMAMEDWVWQNNKNKNATVKESEVGEP